MLPGSGKHQVLTCLRLSVAEEILDLGSFLCRIRSCLLCAYWVNSIASSRVERKEMFGSVIPSVFRQKAGNV